jgi:hypothetical protein
VLRPKVNGAWALHWCDARREARFLRVFLVAGFRLGIERQAHYAAANAFLDGLAHYRQSLGLPATSINWGPWSDGGMVSGEAQDWLQRSGVNCWLRRSVDLFGGCPRSTAPQIAVADVDWPILTAPTKQPAAAAAGRCFVSAARPAAAVVGAQTALLQQLQDLPQKIADAVAGAVAG